MTVIAWDGKILAADRFASDPNTDICLNTVKIFKESGFLCAFYGDMDKGYQLVDWYLRRMDTSLFPDHDSELSASLVVVENKKVYLYERTCHKYPMVGNKLAFGVGSGVALGALEAGASAVEAVKIASKLVSGCGGGVDFYEA